MREVDIDEVMKTVQGALPPHIGEDNDVTVTLVEKNLKIMKDMALMKEALSHLVRNAIPGCNQFSLTLNRVNFGIEALLKSDETTVGAFTFIPLAGIGTYICVDKQIQEKIFEPFFTITTDGNGRGLALAYRIIKHYQSTDTNIYLPLTKLEIVNMMSLPVA
ncbi:MAG: hypothetical protein M0P16_02755 [Syntrophales bacterium]|nr:hypothetical protein [Syntrophales bacterium]